MVQFGDDATTIIDATPPGQADSSKILVYPPYGQTTAMKEGLEKCKDIFAASPMKESKHAKVLVLLTDGEYQTGNPESVATDLKSSGVEIFTIGLGPDVKEDVLNQLSSGPSYGYLSKTFLLPDSNIGVLLAPKLCKSEGKTHLPCLVFGSWCSLGNILYTHSFPVYHQIER